MFASKLCTKKKVKGLNWNNEEAENIIKDARQEKAWKE